MPPDHEDGPSGAVLWPSALRASGCRGRAGAAGLILAAVLMLAALLPVQPARAHQPVDPEALAASGLAIPNLTHGEMAVVARHAAAIRDLAKRGLSSDPDFRRLANFAALQRTYCLWGLMPGSLDDEDSPFNACSHAYLSALRALLAHMRHMPDRRPAALALEERIARDMADASNEVCINSGDFLTTARLIEPEWRAVLAHPPTLGVFAGLAVLAVAALWALFATDPTRRLRPPG